MPTTDLESGLKKFVRWYLDFYSPLKNKSVWWFWFHVFYFCFALLHNIVYYYVMCHISLFVFPIYNCSVSIVLGKLRGRTSIYSIMDFNLPMCAFLCYSLCTVFDRVFEAPNWLLLKCIFIPIDAKF
jgi:hypothetical protein